LVRTDVCVDTEWAWELQSEPIVQDRSSGCRRRHRYLGAGYSNVWAPGARSVAYLL